MYFILSLLYSYLLWIEVVRAKGRRIDIFNENGGDIAQLRNVPKSDVMYNALPQNSALKWSKQKDAQGYFVIPYVITGIFDSSEKSIISEAMEQIEKNTCIRFRRRENERDYVEIRNEKNEGCYTNVGRSMGRNVVMLEANEYATCIESDIVIHELIHSIGLWHEHMRYDRDDFITVHYENIQPVYYTQFEKVSSQESTTYGVPYDYNSVMHYAQSAFAKKGKISMETKDPTYQNIIGHQRTAAPSDYKKICMLYECGVCPGANEITKEWKEGDFGEETENREGPWPIQPGQGGGLAPGPYLPAITSGPLVQLPNIEQVSACSDRFPDFCISLQRRGVLPCSLLGDSFCCDTCNSYPQASLLSTIFNIN